jgi:PKHD-type hydroxylase
LSDEKDYTGGQFQIDVKNKMGKDILLKVNEIRPRGSVIVFPSHEWHRITPVTKGTRYSLVIWAIGKPFR